MNMHVDHLFPAPTCLLIRGVSYIYTWQKGRYHRDNHDRELRKGDDFLIPCHRTDQIACLPLFNVPKIWHDTSSELTLWAQHWTAQGLSVQPALYIILYLHLLPYHFSFVSFPFPFLLLFHFFTFLFFSLPYLAFSFILSFYFASILVLLSLLFLFTFCFSAFKLLSFLPLSSLSFLFLFSFLGLLPDCPNLLY